VRERQHYGFVAEEPSDPDVVMTYRLDSVEEMVPWLRSWGPAVEVLSPPELRSRLRHDAQLVLDLLTGLAEQPSP
jgi:predicted DNA-binding transcriptional regulator YafY